MLIKQKNKEKHEDCILLYESGCAEYKRDQNKEKKNMHDNEPTSIKN